ncbi:MAG: lysozyme inhibitor LprI family protein [Gemmatimonadaceae bacterium]
MMRPLTLSILVAASTLQLSACDEGAQGETTAAVARDSSLAHDLILASADTAAFRRSGSSVVVSASPGALVPSTGDFTGPSCASPALPDQRRCLLDYLARSDVKLDRTYQSLITALKREAGASARGKEPPTVLRLRTAQRNWLVYRDNECRRQNDGKEGPLWATTRAQCLAQYSGKRTEELASALASRSNTTAVKAKPAAAKRVKQVASRQAKRKRR